MNKHMIINTVKDIGMVVREQRRLAGWDQQRLANEVGVSRPWIIQLEQGKPRAATHLVLRTLRVLGLALQIERTDQASVLDKQRDAPPQPHIDIDAAIESARGRKR